MKKILLTILISFLSLSINITCMEKEESESGQIAGLPKELWSEIAGALSKSTDLREAVKNIQELSKTNKALHRLLEEPRIKRYLVDKVAHEFNADVKNVEALFGLPEAKEYLEEFLTEFKNASPAKVEKTMSDLLKEENTVVLNYLFKNGISPDEISKTLEENILVLASKALQNDIPKKWRMLKFLIEKEANINAIDYFYRDTILLRELNEFHSLLIRKLINENDAKNFIENIQYLLEHGADVNLQTHRFETPLGLAIDIALRNSKYIDLVKLILEKGARVQERDLELAQHNSEILNLLNNYKNK